MANFKYLVKVEDARPASGDVPSASAVYRHVAAKDGYPPLGDGSVKTLYELFTKSVERNPTHNCLGRREKRADGSAGPYVWKTYKEVADVVASLASGLRAIGVQAKQSIGVFGTNCPEWMEAMQACNRLSAVCVPIYDSLGENAIEYIINHSESVVAFVSTEKLPGLVKALDMTKATLKSVVYWGPGHEAAAKAVTEKGYSLYSFEDLLKLGRDKPSDAIPPSADDLCTIMYTSGTTGDPKGVLLKHSAIVAAVANCWTYCEVNNIKWNYPDSLLSYLPLAHIFDRVNEELFLYMGCSIGYWQGDINKLMDDIAELKPAMFVGVPRVYDRVYARVMGQLKTAGFAKRALFNWGMNRKLFFMRQGKKQSEASPFFDHLVFSKVAARLGGQVKAVVSGGAPLAPHVEDFLRVTMCAPVVQGYGLSETGASSFIASADVMTQSGTVGPCTPQTEFRLESVPEMNYDALDPMEPKGEVLIRGPAVFTGYHKDLAKTEEVLEKNGWFHTGDIAKITSTGALQIIDRKKNIFKLSQGEYVAVEKLESSYKKNLLVDQLWVYGNSFKNSLVAVVVPNESISKWASGHGISGDMAQLCANPKVKEYVLLELQATGKAEKLKGYEMIKAVHLEPNPFTIEDDLLTPSYKLKRPQLLKKYQKEIDALYSSMKE